MAWASEFGIEAHSFLAKTTATTPLEIITPSKPQETFNRQIDVAGIEAASPVTQAGAHPDATVSFTLNHNGTGIEAAPEAGEAKDVRVDLPPGLMGDPEAVPACGREAFQRSAFTSGEPTPLSDGCPPASQVGVAMLALHYSARPRTAPVYRIVTAPGYPASFGIPVAGFGIILNASVLSEGDYGLAVDVTDVAASPSLWSSTVTFWGVPTDRAHDSDRWNGETQSWGATLSSAERKPLLSNPTWCESGPLTTSVALDSWQKPGHFLPEDPFDVNYLSESPQPLGCEALSFGGPGAEASLTLQPAKHAAETPTGYEAKLTLPYNENPEGFANPTLRDATVTLPEGVVINPAGANGLGACSEQQIGYVGSGFPMPRPMHFSGAPAECPEDSKIGTVEVHTPLLNHPLKGEVYVAEQGKGNPFGSLLAIYLAVYDRETGIVVKLAGEVTPDPTTGQLTATFTDNPQLPFTELDLSFFGGPQASLRTPATCGTYTTSALLTPWSAPQTPAVTSTNSFKIDGGPNGAGCVASETQQPNSPSFEAGTVNPAAGAYSPFAMRLTRNDGSQRLKAVDVSLPPGLAGKIAGVTECPQSAIALAKSREGVLGGGALENASPACPASSLLGTATVTAGAGQAPYPVSGNVYFAGPYKGAPFSLLIVTPAVAGPYDLGTVVVRAALFIDPHTAQVSVKSDPIPSILHGIPLDIRSIGVKMTRNDFTFNPTNCEPMSVGGTVESLAGAKAAVSDRFQAAGCRALPFKPSFSVSTQAKVSRKDGASLKVMITQKPGEANLHKVDVQLPKILPSREETLKLACTAAQFESNPAACPAESKVGEAVVHTPILSSPLQGPAILVSHGGVAFPDLDLVLQGEGITIIATGHTQISKKGITYSRFETIPDAPISSMELNLPEGKYSILGAPAAKGSLCGRNLVMPTTIVGQNGAQIEELTRIKPEGCSNTLSVRGHHIKKRTLTLKIYVPTAGRLHVGGKGIRGKTRKIHGMNIVTVKVHEKRPGKLKTRVLIRFKAAGKGVKRQTKRFAVKFHAPKDRGKHHGRHRKHHGKKKG